MADDDYTVLREEYAREAGRYDRRWSAYVEGTTRETLRRLRVAENDRVLDVGCGSGVLLDRLARTVPGAGLAGVDLSGAMLDVARRRLGPGVELCRAAAEALPCADASFDTVVSVSVFHFIRRPEAALREMRRVLAPGGRLVLTDWCADYLACRLLDAWLRRVDAGHYRTYDAASLRSLLARTGWAVARMERYRVGWFWGLMTVTAVAGNGGHGRER